LGGTDSAARKYVWELRHPIGLLLGTHQERREFVWETRVPT